VKLPRDLNGSELVKVLCRDWGYRKVHQTGSHAILDTDEPSSQRLSIPQHKPLRLGTLHAILRAVSQHKGVPLEAILD
jgi:predicted RNA binding protein YcfA (HicA-like mRNA interferase family)